MRAQGRQPDTDPMAISSYWTTRAFDDDPGGSGGLADLMAKKCWLTLWNAEVPNNKAFAFLQERILLAARSASALGGVADVGAGRNLGGGKMGESKCAFHPAGLCGPLLRRQYRLLHLRSLPLSGVARDGGHQRRRVDGGPRNDPPPAGARTACLLAGMALLAALSLHNWFGAKLPSFARDYFFRSIAWYEKGRFEEALADINRSVELDPIETTALHHRGNVLFALNHFEEARKAYKQTLKFSPGEGGVWNNLGAALDELGRTDEALNALRHATECKPPSKNAFLGLAFIQFRSGRLDDAAATLDQIERLDGGADAAVLATRSALERRRGNAQQAEALEQQARRLDPNAAAWAIERASKTGHP